MGFYDWECMPLTTAEIENDFIHKLEHFAESGYVLGDGHALREGTQREAFDAYVAGLKAGHRHGYDEIPTGVGKTAGFLARIKCYLDAANGGPEAPRVLIAVPTERLAVQTANAIARFLPEIAPTLETDDSRGEEIDWKNSQLGLQYGKVKHANRKPKILITTYQSLIRDEANVTYPPNEFGLVVYDEGHVLTSPEFGKAVKKFENSLQLGVTATPEYTEEKTVAEKLPHRYFTLPLKEALNRGDLCNVRPVLLKTHYKIDEEAFQEFIKIQDGRPLSKKQLETLLNQETRNRAAFETYFLASDPDSGERYLGQNGAIYGSGIAHVDDFVRLADRMLAEERFAPIRQWLDNEGLELIAPVHGKTKGAYLKRGLLDDINGAPITEGRKLEGNKEWYSEDEIFDLHAKGKILLLNSVDKLKLGYDSPRDSFLVDLVDRFSKVEATQIDGRAFRRDPENPDKLATIINMVDENTYELYKDKPQMLPIYCAEVIEGAEFRIPMRRAHAIKNFKSPPPEMRDAMEQAGFELITDIDRVREISEQYKKKRSDSQISIAGEDWKTIEMLGQDNLEDLKTIKNKLEALLTLKRAEGITAQFLDENWAGARLGPTKRVALYVSPLAIQKLTLTPIAEKPKAADFGWRSINSLKSDFVGNERTFNKKVLELIDLLKTQGLDDKTIEQEWVGLRSGKGSKISIHLSSQAVSSLSLTPISQKPKPPKLGWKNAKMLAKEFNEADTTINKRIYDLINNKHLTGVDENDIEDNWAAMGSAKGGSRRAIFVSPEAVVELALTKVDATITKLPPEWKSAEMLLLNFKGGGVEINNKIRSLVKELESEGLTSDEIRTHWVAPGRVLQGKPVLFVSPHAVSRLGLSPRGKKPPLEPADWRSSVAISQDYSGDIKQKIHQFLERKILEGMSPEEIDKELIGIRIGDTGREALSVSPGAIAEMEDQGLLTRRSQKEVRTENTNEALSHKQLQPRGSYVEEVTKPRNSERDR